MPIVLREEIKPEALVGFSQQGLDGHFGLYRGYVNNARNLLVELQEATGHEESLTVKDRRRRLGFEMSGVVLHELYFEMLTPGGGPATDEFKGLVEGRWGSWMNFIDAVKKTCGTRGIGWVLLQYNPDAEILELSWIDTHQDNHFPGSKILLALDCWEHAYIPDWGAAGRGAYVEALIENIDWGVVSQRM